MTFPLFSMSIMDYGLVGECATCDASESEKVFLYYREDSNVFICGDCLEKRVCTYCDMMSPTELSIVRDGFICCSWCDAELNEPMPRNLY